MPSMVKYPDILRQWTVRYASEETRVCFVSQFPRDGLPIISKEDLPMDAGHCSEEGDEEKVVTIPWMFRVEALLSQPVQGRRLPGLGEEDLH
jgi:hypothetical protein